MHNILFLTVFRYLNSKKNGRGNVTKLQPKVRSFHGQWGLIFMGTAHLALLTL